jgi:hypothetical protein
MIDHERKWVKANIQKGGDWVDRNYLLYGPQWPRMYTSLCLWNRRHDGFGWIVTTILYWYGDRENPPGYLEQDPLALFAYIVENPCHLPLLENA